LGGLELYRRYTDDANDPIEEIESHHLFEGEQRVLLVDDVLQARTANQPGPNGLRVREQTLLRYQYGNHLGSVGLELDHQARLISYEEFHPYGTSAYRFMNDDPTLRAPAKRYRYTGMERDEESGLSYHTARYYLPWLGRWSSTDPIGTKADICLYRFCHSQPISHIDTDGKEDKKPGNTLGQNMENLRKEQQLAANRLRAAKGLKPIAVDTQVIIDNNGNLVSTRVKGSTVPDEVRPKTQGATGNDPGSAPQLKGRHVASESNRNADAMAEDIANAAKQASGDAKAAKRAGLIARNAKGKLIIIVAGDAKKSGELADSINKQLKTGKGAIPEALEPVLKANPNMQGRTQTTETNVPRANVVATTADRIARARNAANNAVSNAKTDVAKTRGSGNFGKFLVFVTLASILFPKSSFAQGIGETLDSIGSKEIELFNSATDKIYVDTSDPSAQYIQRVLSSNRQPSPGELDLMNRHGYQFEGFQEGEATWRYEEPVRRVTVAF